MIKLIDRFIIVPAPGQYVTVRLLPGVGVEHSLVKRSHFVPDLARAFTCLKKAVDCFDPETQWVGQCPLCDASTRVGQLKPVIRWFYNAVDCGVLDPVPKYFGVGRQVQKDICAIEHFRDHTWKLTDRLLRERFVRRSSIFDPVKGKNLHIEVYTPPHLVRSGGVHYEVTPRASSPISRDLLDHRLPLESLVQPPDREGMVEALKSGYPGI